MNTTIAGRQSAAKISRVYKKGKGRKFIHRFEYIKEKERELRNYSVMAENNKVRRREREIYFPRQQSSVMRRYETRISNIVRNFRTNDLPSCEGRIVLFFVGSEFRNRRPSEIILVILNSSAR